MATGRVYAMPSVIVRVPASLVSSAATADFAAGGAVPRHVMFVSIGA
jgi:hypothetical protein